MVTDNQPTTDETNVAVLQSTVDALKSSQSTLETQLSTAKDELSTFRKQAIAELEAKEKEIAELKAQLEGK